MECATCSSAKPSPAQRNATIAKKHGTRPKRYASYLKGKSNVAERRFAEALPKVVAHAKNVALAHHVTVTREELATNILSEGVAVALNQDLADGLDGYGAFGIDTLVDRKKELQPFLDNRTKKLIEDPNKLSENVNEKKETVHSLTNLSIEEGMYANASMYVWSKARLAKDLEAQGASLDDLPPAGQFFWSTVYFNAGPKMGKKHLADWGIDAWEDPWTLEDSDELHGQDSRYNAHWRTATFESLSESFDVASSDTGAPKHPWE